MTISLNTSEVIYTIETGVYTGYGQGDDGETDDDS